MSLEVILVIFLLIFTCLIVGILAALSIKRDLVIRKAWPQTNRWGQWNWEWIFTHHRELFPKSKTRLIMVTAFFCFIGGTVLMKLQFDKSKHSSESVLS